MSLASINARQAVERLSGHYCLHCKPGLTAFLASLLLETKHIYQPGPCVRRKVVLLLPEDRLVLLQLVAGSVLTTEDLTSSSAKFGLLSSMVARKSRAPAKREFSMIQCNSCKLTLPRSGCFSSSNLAASSYRCKQCKSDANRRRYLANKRDGKNLARQLRKREKDRGATASDVDAITPGFVNRIMRGDGSRCFITGAPGGSLTLIRVSADTPLRVAAAAVTTKMARALGHTSLPPADERRWYSRAIPRMLHAPGNVGDGSHTAVSAPARPFQPSHSLALNDSQPTAAVAAPAKLCRLPSFEVPPERAEAAELGGPPRIISSFPSKRQLSGGSWGTSSSDDESDTDGDTPNALSFGVRAVAGRPAAAFHPTPSPRPREAAAAQMPLCSRSMQHWPADQAAARLKVQPARQPSSERPPGSPPAGISLKGASTILPALAGTQARVLFQIPVRQGDSDEVHHGQRRSPTHPPLMSSTILGATVTSPVLPQTGSSNAAARLAPLRQALQAGRCQQQKSAPGAVAGLF